MHEKELCGWPIGGDNNRPCVVTAGHKSSHRDAKYAGQQREYYENNKEQLAERKQEYYQANKESIAKCKREYCKANKKRIAERNRAYREANKEQIAERMRKYIREYTQTPEGKEAHKRGDLKRRALKLRAVTGPIPSDITSYLLSLYGAECQQCHCYLTLQATHIDHVIPLAQGGMHTLWNLQPLCSSCNLSKKDKVPADEIELLQLFNKAVGFAPERVMIPWDRKVKG